MAKQAFHISNEEGKKVIRRGVDVKKATEIAFKYFFETYAELIDSGTFVNIRLEEVEKSSDDKSWYITVGYDDQVGKKDVKRLSELMTGQRRNYKIIAINSLSGNVDSMKIREV